MNRIFSHFGTNFLTSQRMTERVMSQKKGPTNPAMRYVMRSICAHPEA